MILSRDSYLSKKSRDSLAKVSNISDVPERNVSKSAADTSNTAPLPSAVRARPLTVSTFSSGKNLLKILKATLEHQTRDIQLEVGKYKSSLL